MSKAGKCERCGKFFEFPTPGCMHTFLFRKAASEWKMKIDFSEAELCGYCGGNVFSHFLHTAEDVGKASGFEVAWDGTFLC